MNHIFKVLSFVLVLGVSNLVGCSASSSNVEAMIGQHAPSTRFTMMNGDPVALSSFRGKTVVLVFWASYCSKSKQVLERLAPYSMKFANRKDVVFLAPSVDKNSDLKEVENRIRILGTHNIQFAFSGNDALDEAYRTFEGEAIPYIVVINPKGEVAGASYSDSLIYEQLKKR